MTKHILIFAAGIALGAAVVAALPKAPATPPKDPHEGHDHGQAEKQQDDDTVTLSDDARKAAGIRVATVAKQKLSAVVTATATIRPNADTLAHVSPKVIGRVVEVTALQGAQVKRGDTLLSIDSIDVGNLATELLEARATLEVAEVNFNREKDLIDRKATTAVALYDAKAQFVRAQANNQGKRDRLILLGWTAERVDKLTWNDSSDRSRLTVTAPIDGEVIEKHATLGEVVNPNDNVFTIADLSTVWVVIDVYQRDVPRVHSGQPVEATADGFPGRVFKGQVAYVGKVLDEDTRTLKIRVALDNTRGLLRAGMFVTARILDDQDEHARECIAAPASAIQRIGGVPVVFIAKAPGLYEKRAVTLGQRYGEHFEVLVGLEGGEEIVTEGSFILKSELLRAEAGHGHDH